ARPSGKVFAYLPTNPDGSVKLREYVRQWGGREEPMVDEEPVKRWSKKKAKPATSDEEDAAPKASKPEKKAQLTQDQIEYLRERSAQGASLRQLEKELAEQATKVSYMTISRILAKS